MRRQGSVAPKQEIMGGGMKWGCHIISCLILSLFPATFTTAQQPARGGTETSVLRPGSPRTTDPSFPDPNYRDEVRFIVMELSRYAKARNQKFIVMGMGSPELLVKARQDVTWERWNIPDLPETQPLPPGAAWSDYLHSLDGIILESPFCYRPGPNDIRSAIGSVSPDLPKEDYDAEMERGRKQALLNHIEKELGLASLLGKEGGAVYAVNACNTQHSAVMAANMAQERKIIGYTTGSSRFAEIPTERPHNENPDSISLLDSVRTVLPVFDLPISGGESGLRAVRDNNYDMLIISPLLRAAAPLTEKDVHALKFKVLGSRRLVLATLPVTVAKNMAYYWKGEWKIAHPAWLVSPNRQGDGMVVRYWDPAWKKMLGQAMEGIITMGFDGVVFTDMDSFRVFEALDPLLE